MSLRQQLAKLGHLFGRRKSGDDLAEEIRSHLEMEEQDNRESGMPADEARYAALRRFGNVTRAQERSREMWSWTLIETFGQDLRYGLRQLRRSPGFTAVAVLTLALGIGANTAIFSVLDAVLLRPLPYPEPQRLYKVWMRFTDIHSPHDENYVSPPEFRDLEQLNKSFRGLAAINTDTYNLGLKGSPERVQGAAVSPGLFQILGVQAQMGRTFLPEEAQPGRDHEILLSHGLWTRAFGANPGVVGSTFRVDAVPMTVVGVMPQGFAYPDDSEVWTPLSFTADDLSPNNRGSHYLEVLARIEPGVSIAHARADMDRVSKTIIEQNRDYPYEKVGFRILLNPLLEDTVGDVKASLWIIMAAVALVLLIACANVANLLLARASNRQRETAVRVAVGAGSARLMRQLLTESALLALLGGLAGLALTPVALRGLLALTADSLPRIAQTRIDAWALAFTLGASLATGILFGLAPALHARRAGPFDLLKSGRGGPMTPSHRIRGALVIGEAALSLLLLAGAGLLLRSFLQILRVDPGFRPEGVLTLQVALPETQYSKPQQVRTFYNDLLERVRRLPGVQAAGAVNLLPLGGQNGSGTVTMDSTAVPLDQTAVETDWRRATPGYFEALGIPLIQGRFFDERDIESSPPVAIIDETLAQTFWPNQDPLGKRLHRGPITGKTPWSTVVGVVRHVHNRTLEARSRVEAYWPATQVPANAMTVVVRASGNPMNLAPAIRSEVFALNNELPVYKIRTMDAVIGDSVARRKVALVLLGMFAGLALLMASVGVYGVTSYTVNLRRPEIGLRMALGARPGQMLVLLMWQGISLTLAGLGIGLVVSFGMTRLMGSMLFSVRPTDPLALGAAAGILCLVAALATLIPARRAMKVDPMVALRYE